MVRRSTLPGRIVDVLNERFPDRVVPHGTWKALSAELGISAVHVGKVAARNGWRVEDNRTTRPVLNVKASILERLELQFSCAEVPFGLYVSLAEEFGVSPQYVRKVAVEAGWSTSSLRPKSAYLCQCGRKVGTPEAVCRECRWVEVACAHCDRPVRRRVEELVRRRASGSYSGRVFCDRACLAAFRKGRPRSQ